MRDHDEVFRRVMQAKEQYEKQEKEKVMAQMTKSTPENGAPVVTKGRKKPSKALAWAMRAVAAVVFLAVIGGLCAAAFLGSKNQKKPGGTPVSGETTVTPEPTGTTDPTGTPNPTGSVAGNGINLADLPAGTVLTMWSPIDESSDLRASFDQAVAEMRTRYPNIDFRVDPSAGAGDEYRYKLATTAQADLPDIITVWTHEYLENLVSGGKVYGLEGAFAGVTGQISEAVCENSTFNGQKYGVPYAVNIQVLFVNMDALRTAGYNTIPTTYNDLIACCNALLAQGITPFGCAGGSAWCVEQYLNTMILKNGGVAALADTYPATNATWTNTDAAEAIDLLATFVSDGYFGTDPASVTDDGVAARNALKNGTCAFYMGGSWDYIELSDSTADIRACEFPVIDSTKGSAGQFVGGASEVLAVSNTSANKDAAAKYAVELGQLISKYVFLSGKALPAWQIDYATNDVNGMFRSIADLTQTADAFAPYNYGMDLFCHHYDTQLEMEYVNLITRAFAGEGDGTTFLGTMAGMIGE